MFSIIASVLHLGNISFKVNEDDSVNVTDKNGSIKTATVGRILHIAMLKLRRLFDGVRSYFSETGLLKKTITTMHAVEFIFFSWLHILEPS